MQIYNHKNEMIDIMIFIQKNMPEDFDYCEDNGYKLVEDDTSVRTMSINESQGDIIFRWVNNDQSEKHFTLSYEDIKFVANLMKKEISLY